jgi:hypothetical protein
MTFRSAIFVLFVLSGEVSAFAQNIDKYTLSKDSVVNRLAGTNRVYYAFRTDKRPKIDGKLTDACWETGSWSSDFVQQLPNQGKKPSQDTEIKILYDDNYIYVAFKCYDSGPGEIRPILTRRDESVGNGDVVGIAFDSYHDKQTAYEFNVGASGQKVDLVHLVSGEMDYNWDAVWDGKSQVYDSIWTVEMEIPFSQIHFAPGKEQVWGMHVWRWIDRLQEESQWKLVPVDAPAMVYLFGELKGIEGVRPKPNYEFLPYLSTRFSPNTDMANKMTYGAGLNGKVGLNSGFILDYAFNPDFGQVESDPAVLNLTTYEVYNEEKRPFFLEGNTILDYSIGDDMLYYSRRIGHAPSDTPDLEENQTMSVADNTSILSALKFTGKTKDGLSVGVVQSLTAKENATIYTGDSVSKQAVEPFSSFIVGRVKQDFNSGNTVLGGMVTSTIRSINDDQLKFLSNSAMSGGLDFQHNWKGRKYFIDYKGFFSDIHGDKASISRLQLSPVHYYQRVDADYLEYDPERTSLSGYGGFLSGGKRSGRFRAVGSLNWRSPGLDLNDLGYIKQADYIQENAKLTYKVNKPLGIMRSYYTEFTQDHFWSFGGENTLDRLNLHGFIQFNNLWLMHANLRCNFNNYDTRELRGGPKLYKDPTTDIDLYFQTNSTRDFWAGVRGKMTTSSDNITKTYALPMYLKWQVSNQFSITSTTNFDHTIDHHEYILNTKYLVGTIDRNTISSTLRFEYFLSPEFSVQYYGNPYASIGKYNEFREVKDASNRSLDERYGNLVQTNLSNNQYLLKSESGTEYTIHNPDFNYQEFSSNLVGRWEFKPGSTIYLVWTNTRSAYSDNLDQNIWKSFGNIWNVAPQNVFMIKFSYWFSL